MHLLCARVKVPLLRQMKSGQPSSMSRTAESPAQARIHCNKRSHSIRAACPTNSTCRERRPEAMAI
jgi:hypothetical protein